MEKSFIFVALLTQKDTLLKVSKYLVVDAYFSKFSFVESLSFAGFMSFVILKTMQIYVIYSKENRKAKEKLEKLILKTSIKNTSFSDRLHEK